MAESLNGIESADDPELRFFYRLRRRTPHARVTSSVVIACIVVFLLEVWWSRSAWDIPAKALIELGANFGPAVQSGEVWRLLTSVFLHGSPLHLALNMLALWQAGQLVERLYGHPNFAFIYLASGLTGSVASMWWQPTVVSVGASGAVFGVFGALAAYQVVQRGEMPMALLSRIRNVTVLFLGYSLFAGLTIPRIDNAAHLGGLVAGALLGAGLARPIAEHTAAAWRRPAAWGAVLASVALVTALWHTAPQVAQRYHQQAAFQQLLSKFALAEAALDRQTQAALNAVQARQVSPSAAAAGLQGQVIPAWGVLAKNLASMQVAADDKGRQQALIRYATLRQQAVVHVVRALNSGEQRWLDSAANLRLQGDKLLLQWRIRELMGASSRP